MNQIVVIADDLTGAADSGVAFAIHGLRGAVVFGPAGPPDIDVLMRSTESRDGDVEAAMLAHQRVIAELRGAGESTFPRWVYKKVDSALRGHPGEELIAVMDALGETTALVAPALPSQGRTTVDGRQYVGDPRLERDSGGTPGGGIDLIERFSRQPGRAVRHLRLETVRDGTGAIERFLSAAGEGIMVVDAETDADLFTIASAVAESPIRVLCGSAGFARQCARALPLTPSPHAGNRPAIEEGPVLIVAGSTHPATLAQVDHLRRAGYPVVRPVQAMLEGDVAHEDSAASELARHVASGRSAILTTAGMDRSPRGASFVAARLAGIVAQTAARTRLAGLIISGGDVAANILSGLDATLFHLCGEVRPAMPWGIVESPTVPPLLVATKAGSFGDASAIEAAHDFLTDRLAGR